MRGTQPKVTAHLRAPMSYVIRWDEAQATDLLGGKGKALAALRKANLPIPPWIVVTPKAFDASLTQDQREGLATADHSTELFPILHTLAPSSPVAAELQRALVELCPQGERVAVRSSAIEEDSTLHSLAGQLESFLFVSPADVPGKVGEVWRSAFSERVLAYRRAYDLSVCPPAPAVLIQRMVHAEAAGVAFSADPVTGRRSVSVVSAVYGLGTALVSGACDADTYHVDRAGKILTRVIANKCIAHRSAPDSSDGVRPLAVPEQDARRPVLTDEHICAIAQLVRQAEELFGCPQDIEWAIEHDQLYLLQSRPITALAPMGDPDGILNLWDNSNIAESYSGITTPLTFSFIRRAYEEVYLQFCRSMHVPTRRLAEHDNTFRRMLGLIRGRVYYNLLNWYRVLALLPGFTVNRTFMEQMMGVKERLPESLVAELACATWQDRLRDGFHLLGAVGGLILNYWLLPRRMRHFYQRLARALRPDWADLQRLRADELVACYRDLERQLLTRWDAPVLNDFFAMIFYGLLRKLTAQWCGDAEGTLQNDLLCGAGGMISAEPAARVRAMAQVAARDQELIAALCTGPLDAIQRAMENVPEFTAQYRAYLDTFGDRCVNELKLESATLHDDPLPLLRAVGHLAGHAQVVLTPTGTSARLSLPLRRGEADCGRYLANTLRQQIPSPLMGEGSGGGEGREIFPPIPTFPHGGGKGHLPTPVRGGEGAGPVAQERVSVALARHPLRGHVFRWVLNDARARVRDRENLRFARTRVFSQVRRIFVELGRRFVALELLDEPQDIFYLEVEEALGVVEGTTTCTDLKGLVAVRKAEYARYRSMQPPADRFETRGIVHQGNAFRGAEKVEEAGGDSRQGIGCCRGLVRGPVCIVHDPTTASLQPGEILVAERTDPGWIMLLPSAAGLLVERGSLLSHCSIVAREMGIPTVVALSGITRWLSDGDWVEFDGSTGMVRKITPHNTPSPFGRGSG